MISNDRWFDDFPKKGEGSIDYFDFPSKIKMSLEYAS